MRPVGFAYRSALTGGEPVYIELRDLTVLLGANDTGKSRTLVALHEELRALDVWDTREDQPPLSIPEFAATLFAQIDEDEAGFATYSTLNNLVEEDGEPALITRLGNRELTEFDRNWLDELDASEHILEPTGIKTWIEIVRRSAGMTDGRFDPLFGALRDSRMVSLVRDEDFDEQLELTLALADPVARRPEVSQILEELGFDTRAAIPVPILVLGSMPGSLPTPVWVPRNAPAVEDGLLDALLRAVAPAAALEDDAATSPDETEGRRGRPDVWTTLLRPQADSDVVAMIPEFPALCGVAQLVINDVLPAFVADRYRVTVRPRPVTEWERKSPLVVTVESRGEPRRFALDAAAEGLQLWLQLAVLEAASAITRLGERLEGIKYWARPDIPFGSSRDDARLQAVRERLRTLVGLPVFRGASELAPYFRLAALEVLEIVARETDDGRPVDVAELAARGLDLRALMGPGANCYFIDEPERHLHPRIAREAAAWLGRVMGQREAQCVLTTHSVPFLDLGPDATYAYLWREGGRTFSRTFDPGELQAIDLLSTEMGFDRGELLTTVRRLLFVEGRADQVVLEALVGRELRRLGVAVIPVHGVGRMFRVVEADALFRYTAADIYALFDNDVGPRLDEIKDDPEKLRHAARDKRDTELQAAAQLMLSASGAERDVAVLGIPARDMFFLLDSNVVRELYDDYPGHDDALREWEEMRGRTGQNIKWKRWFADQYRVSTELDGFARVTAVMRDRGIVPPEIEQILVQLDGG